MCLIIISNYFLKAQVDEEIPAKAFFHSAPDILPGVLQSSECSVVSGEVERRYEKITRVD